MYCTQCGTANSDGLKFCTNCGTPMMKRGDTPQSRPSSGSPSSGSVQPPTPAYTGGSSYAGYSGYPLSPAFPLQTKESGASGRALISMILSLISPFTCWLFLAIPGLILGKMEMNAIRDGLAPKAGETFAKIGFYVGLAVTLLSLIIPAIWLFLLAIGSFVI
jgi:hypothetical protein